VIVGRRSLAILVVLAQFGSLGSGIVACAGDPQSADETSEGSKSETKGSAAQEQPKKEEPATYTNEDLERMFGPPEPAPSKEPAVEKDKAQAPKGGAALPDPLATIKDDAAREEMRKKLTAEAQSEIAAKTAEIKKLEQRVLRIKNPLLPRPEADMTPEELAEWNGLDSATRVKATEERLEKARAELSEAEARLEKLAP
jgi:hypothetical protein